MVTLDRMMMRDIDIVRKWEGCKLKAYQDIVGVWTIGYGHTGDVHAGMEITQDEAIDLLNEDLERFRACVMEAIKVDVTASMYAAMVSLAFNIGCSAFKGSTLVKKVNARNFKDAAEEFLRWNKAGGRVVQGLINRRKDERELFLSEQPKEVKPMLPLLPIIASAMTALPEFIKIFKNDNVSERNVEAVTKAVDIVVQATGAVNEQQAIQMIQDDPEKARVANEALRASKADIMDIMERENAMTQGNIKSARDFNKSDQNLFGRFKFVHILSLLLVGYTGAFLWAKFAMLTPEMQSMIVGGVMIGGFTAVVGYWLGSSSSSDRKTDMLKDK